MSRRLNPFTAEMHLIDAASDGRAVARHEGRVIFVERGVPGDVAQIHVFQKQKKMLIGRIESLVQPSESRIEPICAHFGVCGGCKWQMMAYETQLFFKQKQVEDAFSRIAKVEVGEVLPILPSEETFHYRNKLEFTFSNKAWLTLEQVRSEQQFEQRVLGFHTSRAFDKIIDIDTCHLQRPVINDIRNAVRDFARTEGISFFDIRSHEGFLRNLVFRTSEHTGELMVVLIVSRNEPDTIDFIFTHLAERFPEITNLLWIHNDKANSSFSDLPFRAWKGTDYITERMGFFDFRISPTSFFQTNPRQAVRLYEVVKSWLKASLPEGKSRHEVVYDLYSGTGSIGIFVAELAAHIVGVEYVDPAVADARENVRLNGLEHFSFHAGDMKKILTPEFVEAEGRPDVIIADPPRAGMDPKVVQRILEIAPPYIIYVSCKPATQARDIELMRAQYEVLAIQPVDMFPQTAHVENVAWLRRR